MWAMQSVVEAVRVRHEQRVQSLQVARGVQAQRQRRAAAPHLARAAGRELALGVGPGAAVGGGVGAAAARPVAVGVVPAVRRRGALVPAQRAQQPHPLRALHAVGRLHEQDALAVHCTGTLG